MKKYFILLSLFVLGNFIFCEGSFNQKKFIKGNINDKIEAVKNSSGSEAIELSKNAIQFSINYCSILGEDRDLAALAVAGVLSLPNSYINDENIAEKMDIEESFYKLYTLFSDETLKISVLNKICQINNSNENFTILLNNYLKSANFSSYSQSLSKSVITTLGFIGNNDSFNILFNCLDDSKFSLYNEEIKNSVAKLMEKSVEEISSLIQRGNIDDCKKIFDLCVKNEKNSNNFKANIAESVLSRTIVILERKPNLADEKSRTLQMDAYDFLVATKWTRAAKIAMDFFAQSKKFYEEQKISDDEFVNVLRSLSKIAPLNCESELSSYLQTINKAKESEKSVPNDKVILSVISTLGEIGDKNAFDSLLSVTYCSYPEPIIKAARDALAGLKW